MFTFVKLNFEMRGLYKWEKWDSIMETQKRRTHRAASVMELQ